MVQIIDDIGTGKTGRLMLLAKINNGIIVTSDPVAAQRKAYNYGLTGFDIISYEDYAERNYDIKKPCYVDEIDLFVDYIGGNLVGYTLTKE